VLDCGGCARSSGRVLSRPSFASSNGPSKRDSIPTSRACPPAIPTAGQRTGTGGGGGATSNERVAQARSGRRGRGSDTEATPAQLARSDIAETQARAARRRVNEIDPEWKPSPSLTNPDSIEGQIARATAEGGEAEARLRELARQEPTELINAYRRQQGLDLLGDPMWSREENSVAICKVGNTPVFGVNSQAFTYTDRDSATAEQLRDSLIQSYPTRMNTSNIGQFPNNAVFHAETTCLLRAARANGGTLTNKTIEVHVDRAMCRSCRRILPLIDLELGDPTVTFIGPDGSRRTMREGSWIK
jgi:hypothetical protein